MQVDYHGWTMDLCFVELLMDSSACEVDILWGLMREMHDALFVALALLNH
jgi:hypothetical protein